MQVDPAARQSALLALLRRATTQESGASFQPESISAAARPANVGAPCATGSVAMLVAMSAQSPATYRAPALRRATQGVDALGRLHRALLSGTNPSDILAELRSWCSAQEGAEEELSDLLGEIELRVLVEIAKAGP